MNSEPNVSTLLKHPLILLSITGGSPGLAECITDVRPLAAGQSLICMETSVNNNYLKNSGNARDDTCRESP